MLKLYAGDDNQSMLSDEQKKELDRRSKLYHQGKLKASSWEEVKQRTRAGR
ncbi:MAG: addiction module protein [Bacteroidetes bacterium]|nr:addiction module protein [Bacteroidota bacterium]